MLVLHRGADDGDGREDDCEGDAPCIGSDALPCAVHGTGGGAGEGGTCAACAAHAASHVGVSLFDPAEYEDAAEEADVDREAAIGDA